MEQKLGGKKCLKIGAYLAKLTSFIGILKDTVPFVAVTSVNSNQIFLSVESAPGQIFHFFNWCMQTRRKGPFLLCIDLFTSFYSKQKNIDRRLNYSNSYN